MTQIGTETYAAPEIWVTECDKDEPPDTNGVTDGLAAYSRKVDVWSIGITCYVMLTLMNPVGKYTT